MVLREFLTILRASNPDFIRQVEKAFPVANTQPTSGDSGRGQAFGQTGPTTLEEQRKLDLFASRNDLPLSYAGL